MGLMTICAQQGPATWMYSTFKRGKIIADLQRTPDI
jgi:hypothetical protein